jgi:hypothetical protein
MKRAKLYVLVLLIIVSLQLAACAAEPQAGAEENSPVKVVHLDGAEPTRLTLTDQAAKRLDIQTAPARAMQIDGAQRTVIPYAAIVYDPTGQAWTYVNSEPLVFVRHAVIVDYIDGDMAVLSKGPDSGVNVVTVGAAELFGSESEFEEE